MCEYLVIHLNSELLYHHFGTAQVSNPPPVEDHHQTAQPEEAPSEQPEHLTATDDITAEVQKTEPQLPPVEDQHQTAQPEEAPSEQPEHLTATDDNTAEVQKTEPQLPPVEDQHQTAQPEEAPSEQPEHSTATDDSTAEVRKTEPQPPPVEDQHQTAQPEEAPSEQPEHSTATDDSTAEVRKTESQPPPVEDQHQTAQPDSERPEHSTATDENTAEVRKAESQLPPVEDQHRKSVKREKGPEHPAFLVAAESSCIEIHDSGSETEACKRGAKVEPGQLVHAGSYMTPDALAAMKQQIREQVMEEMRVMKRPKTDQDALCKREHPGTSIQGPERKRRRPALPNLTQQGSPERTEPLASSSVGLAPESEGASAVTELAEVAGTEPAEVAGTEPAEVAGTEPAEVAKTELVQLEEVAEGPDDESGEEVDATTTGKKPTQKLRNIPSDQVMVMVMRKTEFEQVSVGNEILRGFAISKVPIKLRIITQDNGKFLLLGSLTVEACHKLESKKDIMQFCQQTWTKGLSFGSFMVRFQQDKPCYRWKISAKRENHDRPQFRYLFCKIRNRPFLVNNYVFKQRLRLEQPEPNLHSTLSFFVQLMKLHNFERLKETMNALDGRQIKFGTTCSGIDICSTVIRKTFADLSEKFGVTRLYLYIYISVSIYIYLISIYIHLLHIYIYKYKMYLYI